MASGLLGMAGCVADFSPDPLNSDREPQPDAAVDAEVDSDTVRPRDASARDAGARDASARDAAPEDDPAPTPPSEEGGAPVDTPDALDPPASSPCNIAGKWLVTERFGMEGLGAKQAAFQWYYAEITQKGNQLTYAKSLSCGANVVGIGIAVTMDDSKAWPAYTRNPAFVGRKGTVEEVADGCKVHIDKDVTVRGATVEYYRDLNKPLPKLADRATADKPGWEDWDEDGEPAVTLNITSLSSGRIRAVMRNWSEYSGVVPDGADLLTMRLDWGQSRATLKADNPFLLLDATRDPDQSRSAVELGRMSDAQTAGDDLAICASVRALAKTLTPNASMTK